MINQLKKSFLSNIICTAAFFIIIFSHHSVEGRRKRIFLGNNAVQSEFKYHVSIQKDGAHQCGGAIISDQFILTAAHCFFSKGQMVASSSDVTVISGTTDLQSGSGVVNEVEKIMVLADYVNLHSFLSPNLKDMAVVKLKNKLILDGINQIAINLPAENTTSPSEGETVIAAGYGLTEKSNFYYDDKNQIQINGTTSDTLKTIKPKIINCQTIEEHICTYVARSEDDQQLYGECFGDSGSPLAYKNTVVGIVSSGGSVCGARSSPTTYTRVSFYLKFIYNALNELNNDEMITYQRYPGYYRL